MLLLRCYCCDGAVQQQLRRAYILRVAFERRDAQNERDGVAGLLLRSSRSNRRKLAEVLAKKTTKFGKFCRTKNDHPVTKQTIRLQHAKCDHREPPLGTRRVHRCHETPTLQPTFCLKELGVTHPVGFNFSLKF